MKLKRRTFLQGMGALVPAIMPLPDLQAGQKLIHTISKEGAFSVDFKKFPDRVWPGKSLWSIPMEDWKVESGALRFFGKEKESRVNLLEYQLEPGKGDFTVQASLNYKQGSNADFSAGISVGLVDSTDPESAKSACYFGKGIFGGISSSGHLVLGKETISLPALDEGTYELTLIGQDDGSHTGLELHLSQNQKPIKSLSLDHPESLKGLIALTCLGSNTDGECAWKTLSANGTKLLYSPESCFGPILWSMYTLSKGELRISAQLPPVAEKDLKQISLYFKEKGKWSLSQKTSIDPKSYVATFTYADWEPEEDTAYKFQYKHDGDLHEYEGTIRKDPKDKPLVIGGLTCQHAAGFPYRPLVENLSRYNPDLLYFSGDQIYENNGQYAIKRSPERESILSYLGKWYMFGWAFGEVMRDRPTVCTPDDHDVFQGNLWGEGGEGISMEQWEEVMDAHGGLVQSVEMINVVNQTQTAHLPPPVKPASMKGGISSWFTEMNYGGISFAIISDRLFKSGPEMLNIGTGRIDHIKKLYSPNALSKKGLSMVGEQQLSFLKDWVEDWDGASMKVLLSQTLFANVCTHHGPAKDFLFGDLDSGGWPKEQRDEVLRIVRRASAFHINGDQHIPFLVQYSIDEDRDGPWTFCTPAISTGYPRWCEPDHVNMPFSDRPLHNLPNTGVYRDVFGNRNYIYATGNPLPQLPKEPNRYKMAEAKASGFGIITMDQSMRTIKMEAIRFLANLDAPSAENTFPGWPLTIQQLDCDGRKPLGYLPKVSCKEPNQLVKIYKKSDGELIQAIRIRGKEYVPPVYQVDQYRIEVGETSPVIFDGVEITLDAKETLEA
ncbi:hypothetical protein GCM10007049_35650 [Echinicola pacifica]|uniref:PhoD-like phosphatase metallophosphatase domain-containing protein n=1 Tax=Echinicola pacifica TaxID=346377 RepID=A0A918QCB0_9BACT|nr:alkaline phosphatase D family protein [Echinicola pacifica]GGZ39168.1 hypothetical protein GCM10007049_35650 [Echinicola pacifica]